MVRKVEARAIARKGEHSMLVLTRKKNESIVISENIVLTVVEIGGGKVRLGIDAPKEVSVHRHEVYEAIKRGEVPKQEHPAPEKKTALSL
jgi:carbon storage regulator